MIFFKILMPSLGTYYARKNQKTSIISKFLFLFSIFFPIKTITNNNHGLTNSFIDNRMHYMNFIA